MPTDMPAAIAGEVEHTAAEAQAAPGEFAATTLTVLFTAAAILFVSFVAVVTGLV
jgi:hypothetical protein